MNATPTSDITILYRKCIVEPNKGVLPKSALDPYYNLAAHNVLTQERKRLRKKNYMRSIEEDRKLAIILKWKGAADIWICKMLERVGHPDYQGFSQSWYAEKHNLEPWEW